MKNLSTVAIFLVLISISGVLFYKIYDLRKDNKAKLDQKETFWKNRLDVVNQLHKVELKNEYSVMNKQAVVSSIKNSAIPLVDLVSPNQKLVFVIPEAVCNVCHESVFKLFNSLSQKIGIQNILILVPKDRLREAMAEFSNRSIHASIYGVSSEELKLSVGKGYVPFFFLLDSSMVCKNIFVPNANNPSMTVYYFDVMKARLLNRKDD